jgi:hypothetical protein
MSTTINGDNVVVPGLAALATVQITGGSPVAGQVLVIDGSGNVSFGSVTTVVAGVLVSGSAALGSGVGTVAISGLALTFTPSRVIAMVSKPSGGLTIGASVVRSTITSGGFTVDFTGLTDATTYFLEWVAFA